MVNVVWMFLSHKVLDSDIDDYLEKSLFFTTELSSRYERITKWASNMLRKTDVKAIPAKFLIETIESNKELSLKADNGFRNIKELKSFIGQNYDKNKSYFTTALKTEMSFLKSALYGYKLEKVNFTSKQRVKTIAGLEISMNIQSALKIPNIIADDKSFKLYFSNEQSKFIEINRNSLILGNGYVTFNFFPENNPYFNINQFVYNIKKANQKSFIIVLSSQIEFKYEVEFTDTNKVTPNCYIEIDSLKQINFSDKDVELLKGIN
jgi:hypothetical protein